jgi:hypothetical protein
MNKNLISIVIGIAFSISLLSMSLIATPSIVSKVYAQNSTGNATTKVNNTTSGMSGILTAKNASSSPSKFIGGAPLNQSASNSSSTSNKTK